MLIHCVFVKLFFFPKSQPKLFPKSHSDGKALTRQVFDILAHYFSSAVVSRTEVLIAFP